MPHGVLLRSAVVSVGIVSLILGAAILPQACSMQRPAPQLGATGPVGVLAPCVDVPSTSAPDLGCSAPPNTFAFQPFLDGTAIQQKQLGPTVDAWAWAAFAAMNWPATLTSDIVTYPTGYVRGFPNPALTFTGAQSSDVVVWETFKEKREVFNNVVKPDLTSQQWQASTYPPAQTPDIAGGQVPACAGNGSHNEEDEARALLQSGRQRYFAAGSKLSPALLNEPDETAEVASPAQESTNDLCKGHENDFPPCHLDFGPGPNGPNYPFPPNLLNARTPVGPRVFDPDKNIVYFEVRVNYDYFYYVVANGLNFLNPPNHQTPSTPTLTPPFSLPWRTSAEGQGPGGGTSTSGYDAMMTSTMYQTPAMTPPQVGSIQVKSAWKLLPGKPAANSPYHTTQAIHFKSIPAPPHVCYQHDYFGLIALHIIQRVHTGFGVLNDAEPYGGTFIFATWEHNSIRDTGGYTYVNFPTQGGADQTNPVAYPTVRNALPVTTLGPDPSPLLSTINVTKAVYGQLPANSVWRNYRLIGTQFIPTTREQSLAYNQPYYLANLVVETNRGLQNFQGLPPNITVNSKFNNPHDPQHRYYTVPATGNAYDPTKPNVAFQNREPTHAPPVNMGGCMGCHGVAQLLGSAFSFVLFDGPRGAGIDTPTQVAIPPNPPPTGAAPKRR